MRTQILSYRKTGNIISREETLGFFCALLPIEICAARWYNRRKGETVNKLSFAKAAFIFIFGGITACAVILGCYYLDEITHLDGLFDLIAKCLLIIVILIAVVRIDPDFNIGFGFKGFVSKFMPLEFIPVFVLAVMYFVPFDASPHVETVILTYCGILTTVVWEELYFRVFGLCLFKQTGETDWKTVLLLSLVFGLTYLVDAVPLPHLIFEVVLQSIEAVAHGFFLLALYVKSRNILLPMVMHFLCSAVVVTYDLFSTQSHYFGETAYYLTYFVLIGFFFLVGAAILHIRKVHIKQAAMEHTAAKQ